MEKRSLKVVSEAWPLRSPFAISGYTFTAMQFVLVKVEHSGQVGSGEAAGVYYHGDTPERLVHQVESVRKSIEDGISREALQSLLPPGGARNAIDCALWDLEAKLTSRPAWQLAGMAPPKPLLTTFTCGAADPREMATVAKSYKGSRAIKLKLTGHPEDADRIRAVREARPDVWLSVDANQGFTRSLLERLMPVFVEQNVALVEQPFPVGQEHELDGLDSPIPIAADESIQGVADLESLVGRFSVVNIKLDKCGGLTEALVIAREARSRGLKVMIGNMLGTSLAMAPAFLVGQFCDVVDLDGPVFLQRDRECSVQYSDGYITCPPDVWGSPLDRPHV